MPQIISPRAAAQSDLPQVKGQQFKGFKGRPLGILDNAKTNSAQLLKAVAEHLSARLTPTETLYRDKRGAPTALAAAETLSVLSRCGLVIIGLGT
jgi:hypothetical protein